MMDRLPAVPLLVSDPYLSIWSPADTLDGENTIHWCGDMKPLGGVLTVDSKATRFLGKNDFGSCIVSQQVTPTRTIATAKNGAV